LPDSGVQQNAKMDIVESYKHDGDASDAMMAVKSAKETV
jgi:hypothetical protein